MRSVRILNLPDHFECVKNALSLNDISNINYIGNYYVLLLRIYS